MGVRGLGGALRRQRALVLAILVLTGIVVVLGLAFAPRTYLSTATVSARAETPLGAGPEDLAALRGTVAALADSRGVVSRVQDELAAERDADDLRRAISAEAVPGTILIDVSARDGDPGVAADIANTVARVLSLDDPTGVFVITLSERAEPAETYDRPDRTLVIVSGVLLGVLLAALGALLRERRRGTIDDAVGVEEAADAPLLARVAPPRDPTTLPALYPGTGAAEVFRHLRIALEAEASARPVACVVVAGVTSGDVNLWLGANLAVSLAGVGREVLLVDARMGERFGRPSMAEPDTAGLYDVLAGAPLRDAVSPGPAERLSVLPSGAWGVEHPEVLLEGRFPEVMAEAQAHFDVIVVLAAPLDVSDDARVMAAGAAMLVVVPEGRLSAAALRSHVDRVRAVGTRVLGVVLVARRPERVPV